MALPKLSVTLPKNLKVPGRKPRPDDPEAADSEPFAPAVDPEDFASAQRSGPPTPALLILVGLVVLAVALMLVRGRGQGQEPSPPS